jgi:hypothetical protein
VGLDADQVARIQETSIDVAFADDSARAMARARLTRGPTGPEAG